MATKISSGNEPAIRAWQEALTKRGLDPARVGVSEVRANLALVPPELRGQSVLDLLALATSPGTGRSESGRRSPLASGALRASLADPPVGPASLGHGGREHAAGAGSGIDAFRAAQSSGGRELRSSAPASRTEGGSFAGQSLSVKEVLRAADDQQSYLMSAIADAQRLLDENRRKRTELEGRVKQALGDLTGALLPELSTAAFERAAAVTGYLNLKAEHGAAKLDQKRRDAEAAVARIEADPVYLRGSPDGELRQLRQQLAQPKAFLEACAAQEHLGELLENGFGTERYAKGFLNPTRVTDGWKANEIAARLHVETFDDVRAKHGEATRAVAELEGKIAGLEAHLGRYQALQRELAEKKSELAGGPGSTLDRARSGLAAFVRDLDASVLAKKLAGQPELELYVRADGLLHQVGYLAELEEKKLGPTKRALDRELSMLRQEISRLQPHRSSSRRIPGDVVDQQFTRRAALYSTQLDAYRQVQTSVSSYNVYNCPPSPSYFEAWFWWSVFNDLSAHREPAVIHAGGGDFGGGGASGSWDGLGALQAVAPNGAPPDPAAFFDDPRAGLGGGVLGTLSQDGASTDAALGGGFGAGDASDLRSDLAPGVGADLTLGGSGLGDLTSGLTLELDRFAFPLEGAPGGDLGRGGDDFGRAFESIAGSTDTSGSGRVDLTGDDDRFGGGRDDDRFGSSRDDDVRSDDRGSDRNDGSSWGSSTTTTDTDTRVGS